MPLTSESKSWTIEKIKELIRNETDLLKISISFGVNPTPLRKMMKENRATKYFVKKLFSELKKKSDPNLAFYRSPVVKRLLSIFRIYKQKGTLDKVARISGLSRERVRQLLNRGTLLGLFDYQKIKRKPLPNIPKEKILADFQRYLRLSEVAKINKITSVQLSRLIRFYQITKKSLQLIRIEGKRSQCISQYFSLVKEAGRHLSSSELQRTEKGHYLSYKIIRYWGSIRLFRQEQNILFLRRNGNSSLRTQKDRGAEIRRSRRVNKDLPKELGKHKVIKQLR